MRYAIAAICTSMLLAGCAGGTGSTGLPLGQAESSQRSSAASVSGANAIAANTMAANTAQSPERVYVLESHHIPIFPLGSENRSYTIDDTGPIARPIGQGIAISPVSGNLYVTQPDGHETEIAEYSPDGQTRLATLTGTRYASTVLVDSLGNVYANTASENGGINVYAPGSTTPSYNIYSSAFGYFYTAVDSADDLYALEGLPPQEYVLEFPPGSSTASSGGMMCFCQAYAMIVDPAGQVYIAAQGAASEGLPQGVLVYAPGSTLTYSSIITNGAPSPMALALDANNDLYVGNYNRVTDTGGLISMYAPGTTTPVYSITTPGEGSAEPVSLATGPFGDLYVAYAGLGVYEYRAGTGQLIRKLKSESGPTEVVIGR
jgi:hypothetical protein